VDHVTLVRSGKTGEKQREKQEHTNKETAPEFVLMQHTLSTPKGVPITKNI